LRKRPKSVHRSGCPVSISLELFGDRWSLLIIRDLMVRGYRTFKDFQQSGEGIATNILSDRLRRLDAPLPFTVFVPSLNFQFENTGDVPEGTCVAAVQVTVDPRVTGEGLELRLAENALIACVG
jgi:hypothetical protein